MAIYQGHNEDSSGNLLLSIGNGMTATVETGSTASQAYTKGSYLFFNNRLCKAASAIASGATLTIGGNLTQTSLGAEITSHLRSSDGKEFYFDVKDGTYGYYPSASKTASEFVPFGGTCVIENASYCYIYCNSNIYSYTIKIKEADGTEKTSTVAYSSIASYISNNWSELSSCGYSSSDSHYYYYTGTIKNSGKWFCSSQIALQRWASSAGKTFTMRAGENGNNDIYIIFDAIQV